MDIPDEYVRDYNGDKFKEFFSRVSEDISTNLSSNEIGLCGRFEQEIADMFLEAFDKSKEVKSFDSDRSKVIINNILSEIVETTWESNNIEYFEWLTNEVGLSVDEIAELIESNCMPVPEKDDMDMEM